MYSYDLVIIGAGPAGLDGALKAAKLGLKTAIIEKDKVGGTCLNRGCIPTKALLHASEVLHSAKNSEEFGLVIPEVGYNPEKLHEYKEKVVSTLRKGSQMSLKKAGVTVFSGTATIKDPHKISITGEEEIEISAENILIASGSTPAVPPIAGRDLPGVLTSDDLLEGPAADYQSITIIGGGVIGAEFATYFSNLGRRVVLVEAADRILPGFDKDISSNLSMLFGRDGVKVFTGAMVEKIEKDGENLVCFFAQGEQTQSVSSEAVLIATGRKPFTDGLFPEDLGIETERGRIVTDKDFRTSVKNIYAVGDVSSAIQLAHYASAQAVCAVEIIAGLSPSVRLDAVPSCVYTDPEIATVGLDEEAANAAGISVKVGKFLLTGYGKSLIEKSKRSFIKVIAEQQTGKILGAQLMCARATDLIGEFSQAIVLGHTAAEMQSIIRPHPTHAEAITEALRALEE